MDQRSIQEMKNGFATAYIDGNLASNAEYIPSFISNKPEAGKKVIASLEDEMLKCDKFQIKGTRGSKVVNEGRTQFC